MTVKSIPQVNIIIIIITTIMMLCRYIYILITGSYYYEDEITVWTSLVPYHIYEEFQVWRFITAQFSPNNRFNYVASTIFACTYPMQYEIIIGSKQYIQLYLIALVIHVLLCNAVQAFFHFCPFINEIVFLDNLWIDYAATGQSAQLIMMTVFMFRTANIKITPLRYFNKTHISLFYFFMFAVFQYSMKPWNYGYEYNVAALIVGFLVPKPFITTKKIKQKIIEYIPNLKPQYDAVDAIFMLKYQDETVQTQNIQDEQTALLNQNQGYYNTQPNYETQNQPQQQYQYQQQSSYQSITMNQNTDYY